MCEKSGERNKPKKKRETELIEAKAYGRVFTIKTEFITCLFFIANNLYGQKFLVWCVLKYNRQQMRWFAERGEDNFSSVFFFRLCFQNISIYLRISTIFFLRSSKIKAKKQQNHLLMAHAKRFVVEHYDLVINVYWAIIIKATKRRGQEREREIEENNTHEHQRGIKQERTAVRAP